MPGSPRMQVSPRQMDPTRWLESPDLIKARPDCAYVEDLKPLLDASQEEMSRLGTGLRRMDGVAGMEIHHNAEPLDFPFMYEPGMAA